MLSDQDNVDLKKNQKHNYEFKCFTMKYSFTNKKQKLDVTYVLYLTLNSITSTNVK